MKFTVDHFTRNLPQWQLIASYFEGRPINYLELGTREGMSLFWVLDNLNISRAACVDTWENKTWENNFLQNLKERDLAKVIYTFKEDATEFCLKNKSAQDLIYIDADHLATSVLTQAVLCWRVLTKGGILVFDDYGWQGGNQNGGKLPPSVGIDCFLATFIEEYELIHKGWQVIIKKK